MSKIRMFLVSVLIAAIVVGGLYSVFAAESTTPTTVVKIAGQPTPTPTPGNLPGCGPGGC